LKDAAVGTSARPGSGSNGCNTGFREVYGEGLQIAEMSGPADQARFSQFSNYGVLLRSGLLGVGGDDLEIPSCAEREEGVLRTAPGMNAAKCSANARARLDEGDAALEITAAQKNVIEQRWHPIRRPRRCGRRKSTTSDAQKDSARNESQHWRLF